MCLLCLPSSQERHPSPRLRVIPTPIISHRRPQLSECNDAMGRLLAQGARTSSSALLQRYREILFYYTTEFQKTSVAIQRKKESAELLRGASGGWVHGRGLGMSCGIWDGGDRCFVSLFRSTMSHRAASLTRSNRIAFPPTPDTHTGGRSRGRATGATRRWTSCCGSGTPSTPPCAPWATSSGPFCVFGWSVGLCCVVLRSFAVGDPARSTDWGWVGWLTSLHQQSARTQQPSDGDQGRAAGTAALAAGHQQHAHWADEYVHSSLDYHI